MIFEFLQLVCNLTKHDFLCLCQKSWFNVSYVKFIIFSQFRSKSCPQCQKMTTEKTIHQIYFNVASKELEEDINIWRNKIDDLDFQIHQKDTVIKNITGKHHTLIS